MSVTITNKQSGTKWWQRITGPKSQLTEVSKVVQQPIKPAKNNQAEHIDRPIKRRK
jgi:hypothetical protein